MADPTVWMEVAGLLVGGGGVGAIGTYLGVRKKTQSDLEIAYMSQLGKMAERIDSLEKREDRHWDEIRKVVREERESCDQRMRDMEKKFEEELRAVKSEMLSVSESHVG